MGLITVVPERLMVIVPPYLLSEATGAPEASGAVDASGAVVSVLLSLPQAARLNTMTRARHRARNLTVFFIFLVLSFHIFARFISFIKLISILQRLFIKLK